MRLIFALALLPLPAVAWEFSPDPICTLSHQAEDADIVITYDDRIPEYTLIVTLKNGIWDDAAGFFLDYPNGTGPNISTDRHELSDDGTTLTVRDRGFGNVLTGLEDNAQMVMTSGDTRFGAFLDGAYDPVQAFRNCPADVPPSS